MATTPALGADKATDEYRYFTAVYRIPQKHAAEFATECCESKYWSAASWSHALDERDAARAPLAAVPASEPVAWMKTRTKECASDEHKKRMENAGFGVWDEVAAQYTIPLYAAAPAPVSGMPDLVCRVTIVRGLFGQEKSIQWKMLAELPQGTHDLCILAPTPNPTGEAK